MDSLFGEGFSSVLKKWFKLILKIIIIAVIIYIILLVVRFVLAMMNNIPTEALSYNPITVIRDIVSLVKYKTLSS